MTAVPNAQRAMSELVSLREQVAQRAAVRTTEPMPHDEALALAEGTHMIHEISLWCRDASIALARTAEPPVSWGELETLLDIRDSTLTSRLDAWRDREGGR